MNLRMQRITTYLLRSAAMVMAVLFSVSCTKDDAPHYPHASRVYMAGDNSLGGYVWDNLDAMRRGMASAPAGSRTIAYVDTPDGNPRLLEVTSSGTQILYTWPSVHNSASAATVCEVVSLVRTLAPADRYGLVLWSHGLAWMPSWATGYLTRSKARIGDIWPQTKHDGAASETSVFFNPAARPASAPASVTATGSAPDDRSIPTVSVPTFRPTAKHDGMLYASFASSMRPVPGFGPVAAGRDTGSGGIPSSVRFSSAERIAPAMPASCVAFPFVGAAFPHRPVPALRFDTETGRTRMSGYLPGFFCHGSMACDQMVRAGHEREPRGVSRHGAAIGGHPIGGVRLDTVRCLLHGFGRDALRAAGQGGPYRLLARRGDRRRFSVRRDHG